MNILFFLTPKSEVIYVNEEDTVGQAMDTMEKYKYSAVPIITKAGRYAGTLTEGDLLWGLKNKTDLVQKGLLIESSKVTGIQTILLCRAAIQKELRLLEVQK